MSLRFVFHTLMPFAIIDATLPARLYAMLIFFRCLICFTLIRFRYFTYRDGQTL